MPYIHLNKKTDKLRFFGSLKTLSEKLDIDLDNLYYNFSKKKVKEIKNENYRIVKAEVEKSVK